MPSVQDAGVRAERRSWQEAQLDHSCMTYQPAPKRGGRKWPPLRVGILVGKEENFQNWELRLFDRLMADPRFQLRAILVDPNGYGPNPTTPQFRFIAGLDRMVFARQPVYRPAHFDDLRGQIQFVRMDAMAIPEDLDLVIRTIPRGLPNDVVAVLPFGEWVLSFVTQQSRAGDWSGFAGIVADSPTSRLFLHVNRGRGALQLIDSADFNPKFSATRNAAFVKEKSVLLLTRELRRLADERQLITRPDSAACPPELPPGGLEMGKYLVRLIRSSAMRAKKELAERMGFEKAQWTLYSGTGSIEDFDPRLAEELPPTKDSIKADPFLFRHDGETYVFYENYAVGDLKAHIAVGRLVGGGIEPLGPAIESRNHLSFPFVFRHGDGIYMMPETHQEKRIEIWRCLAFPLRWELYSTALEGCSAADSTLFQHRGRWWLLTNLSDHHAFEDHCSELYAFQVDGPQLSRLVPHARNPVVIDSTVARNAGRVFSQNGRLFRPSQRNVRGTYGYGLNIMEIKELNRQAYRETCLRTIWPDFGPRLAGCHHFDAVGNRYILDARLNG
jgi:hypothetical protein